MWTTALSNSMKLWAMPCRATQNEWVIVESYDKMWSPGEGNGKPLSILALRTPLTAWKCKMTLKDELLMWVGAQYATGEEWRNNSERMKSWRQSKNDVQLWMSLVVEVKSNTVKNNIAKEPEMLGPWIKVNWKWSNRRWQKWTLTF